MYLSIFLPICEMVVYPSACLADKVITEMSFPHSEQNYIPWNAESLYPCRIKDLQPRGEQGGADNSHTPVSAGGSAGLFGGRLIPGPMLKNS